MLKKISEAFGFTPTNRFTVDYMKSLSRNLVPSFLLPRPTFPRTPSLELTHPPIPQMCVSGREFVSVFHLRVLYMSFREGQGDGEGGQGVGE